MAEPLAQRLAAFATKVFRNGLPDAVVAKTAHHILDTLGVAIAGREEVAVQAAREVVTRLGGIREATVVASRQRLPAPAAALVNGTMAHALDFDDTHLPSVLHPSASVVPTALAIAEAREASGEDLLRAVAVGVEIVCRLGMAGYDSDLGNSVFFENGFHATSICGTLGSAASAALISGADEDQVAHAMAVAASMGAGLLEANRAGGTVKPLHCGWAAHAGLTAGRLALAGLTGPPTVLEGRFGFFRAYAGGYLDRDALVGDLGARWEMERLCIKPYPTNHFTHAAIDAAIALRNDGVDPKAITQIELGVPAPVLRTIAEPQEEKARPTSGHQAKFSGPFTVATALLGGGGLGVDHADFTDVAVQDQDRLRLAALVHCTEDEEATAAFPNEFPAVLRIRLSDGSLREHRVKHVRGGPTSPMTTDELVTKFRMNADPLLGAERAERAAASILQIASLRSLEPLLSAWVSGRPSRL